MDISLDSLITSASEGKLGRQNAHLAGICTDFEAIC
jgi:hypothetical protein